MYVVCYVVLKEECRRQTKSADMSSSGYSQLPSDPPPAYAPGVVNSAFAHDHNKDIPHAAVPSTMSPYPGVYLLWYVIHMVAVYIGLQFQKVKFK